uniref:Uncharacterized protein n=1 Tax=viral metagenome TaxID=1070528 RepID=A0A6M3JXZ2_9ZZZZ
MTVKRIVAPNKFIGASTDTKPTQATLPRARVGDTFYEQDTGLWFITYDGTNWVSKQDPLSNKIKEVRVTKVIDGGLGAYEANDVVSNEDCCSTTATCWTFSEVARANGAYGKIVGATIVSESEGVVPVLTLFLFNATPTSNLIDNAANTAPDCNDLAKYVGKIVFPALVSLGTTDSTSTITPSLATGNLPLAFKCASDADDLFGILVTSTIFTQTAGDDMTVILLVEQH